jgi:hypothetical protein
MNYYRILGVAQDADTATIKSAYRVRAKELHPDRNPHDPYADELFRRVNEAYQVLSQPGLRRQYDLMLVQPRTPDAASTVVHKVPQSFDTAVKRRTVRSLPALSFRGLPPSHWLLLAVVALYLIFNASSPVANVLMLLFFIMQGLLSSYLVQESMKYVLTRTTFAWATVLMSHAIALILGLVVWLVCGYVVMLIIATVSLIFSI